MRGQVEGQRAISNDQSTLMVQDPEVARIYWDGCADCSSLSEADQQRFDPLLFMFLNGWNQKFHFAAEGVVGPAVWDNRLRGR